MKMELIMETQTEANLEMENLGNSKRTADTNILNRIQDMEK